MTRMTRPSSYIQEEDPSLTSSPPSPWWVCQDHSQAEQGALRMTIFSSRALRHPQTVANMLASLQPPGSWAKTQAEAKSATGPA